MNLNDIIILHRLLTAKAKTAEARYKAIKEEQQRLYEQASDLLAKARRTTTDNGARPSSVDLVQQEQFRATLRTRAKTLSQAAIALRDDLDTARANLQHSAQRQKACETLSEKIRNENRKKRNQADEDLREQSTLMRY